MKNYQSSLAISATFPENAKKNLSQIYGRQTFTIGHWWGSNIETIEITITSSLEN